VSLSAANALEFPLWVHHPVYNVCSSSGLGRRVHTSEELGDLCVGFAGQLLLLQEDVEGDLQKVYFINGRVVSDQSVSRQQEATLANLAEMSRSNFFGVDYLTDGTSAWILEMNDWPSFRGHEKALAAAVEEVLST
jgi:hypothetical protein